MVQYTDILVFCETTDDGSLAAISTEALGCARKLADGLGGLVVAVLVGNGISGLAASANTYGADKVFVIDNPTFQYYQTEQTIAIFEKLCSELKPFAVLMGQTSSGADFAPALAVKLDSTACLDCVDVDLDKRTRQLQLTKPVYGGNLMAVYTTECTPAIATIRKKTIPPIDADKSRHCETVPYEIKLDPGTMKTKLVNKVSDPVDGIRLEDARVVIGGGRGIGSMEGFSVLEQLAEQLKGAVGASRAACDNRWLPSTKQIGLTGKVVAPDLYFAIGISGASQHMAGCSGASNIIAINNDDGANIFREAHYGVLGDWKPVLTGFLNKLREIEG